MVDLLRLLLCRKLRWQISQRFEEGPIIPFWGRGFPVEFEMTKLRLEPVYRTAIALIDMSFTIPFWVEVHVEVHALKR